jgi:hypothetical protein
LPLGARGREPAGELALKAKPAAPCATHRGGGMWGRSPRTRPQAGHAARRRRNNQLKI